MKRESLRERLCGEPTCNFLAKCLVGVVPSAHTFNTSPRRRGHGRGLDRDHSRLRFGWLLGLVGLGDLRTSRTHNSLPLRALMVISARGWKASQSKSSNLS